MRRRVQQGGAGRLAPAARPQRAHAAAELQLAAQQPGAAARSRPARDRAPAGPARPAPGPCAGWAAARSRGAHRAASAADRSRSSAPVPRRAARRSPPHSPVAPNTAVPATSVSAPASMTRGAVSGVMPPSTDSAIGRPEASIIRRNAAIFGSCDARNSWPPNPGLTVITRMMSTRSSTHAMLSDRRRRIQHDAGPLAVRSDKLQRAVQMRPGLRMHQDVVGPGIGERRDERIDRRDHQMHVERQCGVRAQALQDRRAEADVRHEMAVHHVEMQPVGARRLDRRHLVAQSGEIGGEEAWRDGDSAGSRCRHGVGCRQALGRSTSRDWTDANPLSESAVVRDRSDSAVLDQARGEEAVHAAVLGPHAGQCAQKALLRSVPPAGPQVPPA